MIRFFYNEEWKEFKRDYNSKFRYAISNFGRVISFTDKVENGTLLKCGQIGGYKVLQYIIYTKPGKIFRRLFIHRLVATHFIPNKSEDKVFVLHLDHNKDNNYVDNLQWATKEEMIEHSEKSPRVIEARRKRIKDLQRDGHKLTVTQVLFIKKKLFDPNRKTRLKIIARQFGVSEMTLHRIKTGENWGHITIQTGDNEKLKK
ncbi:MAG: HNH endonuclease [Bacteroidales bacterium]|jgi:hypothetical protein